MTEQLVAQTVGAWLELEGCSDGRNSGPSQNGLRAGADFLLDCGQYSLNGKR